MTAAKAKSIDSVKISEADKIKKSFSKRQWEAVQEHFRKKFQLQGRQTSSKKLLVLSDLHIGSKFALYSGYAGHKISNDQQKLLEHWLHVRDEVGHVNLLLCNGDVCKGSNPKQNAYQLWSADLNEQISDAQRLISQYKYDKLLLTMGSNYHVQQGQTSYEETLGIRMNSIRYNQMFDDAIHEYHDRKGMVILQDSGSYDGVRYNGKHANYYVFFDIHGKLFNATHHVGFSKWQAYRVGAISRELSDLQGFARGKYFDIDRNIDVLIRSHVHYFVYYEDQDSRAFTSPAFKFPDQHLYRGGLGGTYPSIGAVSVIVESNGKIQVEKHLMSRNKMPRPEVLRI